ncbi:MAG TPA: OmpH family outer membrane protein [Alphaproteobacteria bacterium]|jgi:Skp family chaperone for outer membrane proteins
MFKFKTLLLLVGLLAAVATTAPAQAQSMNIAVVDIQLIMRDSLASKSVTSQIEKQRATYQADITKQENDLRNAEQELNKQRTIVSPEAFAERRRAFEQRVGNLQRDVQNRKRDLDKSLNDAMRTVQTALLDVIGGLVTERKFTLVLIKSQTVYNQPDMEVTQEVLKRLNAKLSSVKVVLPAPTPAAPAAAAPAAKPGK